MDQVGRDSGHDPTQVPRAVKILGPVDVLKMEGKKVESGLKRVRPESFGNGVTFKTQNIEA